MFELTGDILNWLAAGILFPLMILPLAALIREDKTASSFLWLALVGLIAISAIVFAAVVPILRVYAPGGALLLFAGASAIVFMTVFAIGGASRASKMLTPAFEAVTRTTGRAVMWLLLLMALVQFAVVLLRYVFGVNEIFTQESITYMHGAVFLLAAGYTLLTNDHVRVDIFYRDAAPKRKAVIDLLGTYCFLFPICLVILWTASPYVARSWAFFEGSADTSGIQGVFLLKSLIPAFAVLLAMAGFVVAHRAVETLKGRGE